MGWVRCMSSSPDRTPLFSKTLLCDNSSKSSSFSVSDSLSNYDFIEFITDDGSDNTNHFYMTENCIQDIEDLTDTTNKYICFNNFDTNQYVCYTRSGNTWTKAGSRLLNIITVNGFKCANMTMTETSIYKATTKSATSMNISDSSLNLYDYDIVLFGYNAISDDEIGPCNFSLYPKGIIDTVSVYPFNYYNFNILCKLTNTSINNVRPVYIRGYKFS